MHLYICKVQKIWIGLFFIGLFSCKKESFFKGNSLLQFSDWDDYTLDTLTFDTVFTQEPGKNNPISVTQKFWIKNKEKSTVTANFRLGGGSTSVYRISIAGKQGPNIQNVEIPAGDSVWGFAQCSLKPNNTTLPALVLDSILATIGSSTKKMYLQAYGWDATYIRSQQLPCGGSWSNTVKPYVIVDDAFIAKGCTFTINKGVKVYNTPRSTFVVEGTLLVLGTASERVLFTGPKPRLDAQKLPNQWIGIHFLLKSMNNLIQYADIRNAVIGIRCDSLSENGNPKLTLENTLVKYCGQACVLAINSSVNATNCEFSEAGSYTFLGLLGGIYNFNHCTFANYINYTTRTDGSLAITNTLRNSNGAIINTAGLNCALNNSILDGALTDELFIDNSTLASFSFTGNNNIIKSTNQVIGNLNQYKINPLFKSTTSNNYEIDKLSPAINAGFISNPTINIDLLGKGRVGIPDVGAYEFIN